ANRIQRSSRITRYGLTDEDRQRFEETLRPAGIATLPLRTFSADIRSVTERRAYPGRVGATKPRYADLHKLNGQMELGRFLTEQDEKQVANVAVLGSDVADELFPGEDPLQRRLTIQGRAFEVVGVLKERSSGGAAGERYNGDVYIPLRSWRER